MTEEKQKIEKAETVARSVTIGAIVFMLCWGAVIVVAQIRPFWVDEWRLIYNLKFKSEAALWGPLDYTQQFPRVYLHVIKWFTSRLDYSYFSLRLPAYLVAASSMFFCYNLMKRIFPSHGVTKYLFVLILISSQTFTDYLVQTKHYEMEIFLSLLAIWQLLELLDIRSNGIRSQTKYILLCLTFLAAPFFSYTYPIAVAPIFVVVGIVLFFQNERSERSGGWIALGIPLLLCAASIAAFYIIDVSQLMADKNMHEYWSYKMVKGNSNVLHILEKLWLLFAQVGAGLLFEIIFGLLGLCAFGYAISCMIKEKLTVALSYLSGLRLYGVALLCLIAALFFAGKLPLGEPKFNAFAVSAMSVLLILFLDMMAGNAKLKRISAGVTLVLFLGVTGNLISTFINSFTAPEYSKRMQIYNTTEKYIAQAQDQNTPILITPQIAYPDAITINTPHLQSITPDCVLKTFPAYKVEKTLPVYPIDDSSNVDVFWQKLPPGTTSILTGDGLVFKVVKRK